MDFERQHKAPEKTDAEKEQESKKTIAEKVTLSNTLLVFLRRRLGYRLMEPQPFCGLFLILFAVGYWEDNTHWGSLAWHRGGMALMIYACLMALLVGLHREKAKRALMGSPRPIHSYSRGDSVLMPLFRPLRVPEWVVQRFIEPILMVALSLYFMFGLGWWLIGLWVFSAALSFATVEGIVLRQANEMLLDVRDSRIEGGMMGKMDDLITGKRPVHGPDRKGKAAGPKVATLAPELERIKPE